MLFPLLPAKRLARITLGKMLQPEPSGPADIEANYLRAAHVQPRGRLVSFDDDQKMWFGPSELHSQFLKADDVVVVEGGAGFGRSAVVRAPMPNWGFQNSILRLRPIAERTDGRFLDYALQSALADGTIGLVCSTATIPHFTAEKIAAFSIPAPAKSVQVAIADFLDRETAKIDVLIDKQRHLLAFAAARFESAIRMAVRASVGHGNGACPQLRRICRLITGATPSGDYDDVFAESDGLPWFTPEDLAPVMSVRRSLSDFGARQVRTFPATAVLVCGIGATLAKIGHPRIPCSANQQLTAACPVTGVDDRYLYYALVSEKDQIWAQSVGNTLPIINNMRLGSVRVPMPDLSRQRAVARELDELSERVGVLSSRTERSIALAQERRSGLITAAVTGRLDVSSGKVA